MSNSGQNPADGEIGRLRQALEAETQRCVDVQSQLDRANVEFEEFVSTAAHNLRESLRDVASFSQLMAETYAGSLDSDAGVFLQRIQKGAARMESLLEDMVDYWATVSRDRQSSRIDMETVLQLAFLSADERIRDSGAIITHDPLPAVLGDSEILTKVLHHLIRNAIEYCGKPSPRVHISSRQVDCDWVFSVHDNGPGIGPAFKDRLFGVFKRLHGNEHPGNGLGLAFCKKAIEWHGGRMSMESTPGEGSTFYFSLPPAD